MGDRTGDYFDRDREDETPA